MTAFELLPGKLLQFEYEECLLNDKPPASLEQRKAICDMVNEISGMIASIPRSELRKYGFENTRTSRDIKKWRVEIDDFIEGEKIFYPVLSFSQWVSN